MSSALRSRSDTTSAAAAGLLGSAGQVVYTAANAFVECPLAHPTWMLRRDVFVQFPYTDGPWPEDYDRLLGLLRAG